MLVERGFKMNRFSFFAVYELMTPTTPKQMCLPLLLMAVLFFNGCSKKAHKVENPTAIEIYKVNVTAFPPSPAGGGTWDSEIFISDPYGRPDLAIAMFDNLGDTVGQAGGYNKLNSNHSNLPIGFDINPAATVSLDRTITVYVFDKDDFDADDAMGALVTDTLATAKNEQPGYLEYTNGTVGVRLYIRWK